MKARLGIGLITGAFVTIAVACSSSPPPPPDNSVTEFCADWAKAFCRISSYCQFDLTACTTYQTGVCTQFAATAQQSGTRQYSQPNGLACINALNSAYGNNPTSIASTTILSIRDTCQRAFTGNQASDQACTSDFDCSGQLVCAATAPGSSSSVCAAVTQKQPGAICGDPGDECQGDSYCAAVPMAANQCVATPAAGGACSASVPCGTETRCVGGVCAARAAQGQSCAVNTDCTTNFCDTFSPGRCVTELTFASGSYDCNGIAGINQTPTTTADAGIGDSGGTSEDSGSVVDSAAPVDAPTGG